MSSPLTALSPLDGRYASKVRGLQDHFSEFALVVRRLRPYLEAERSRLAAVLASSLFVMVFEGVGVGLLVPLLYLLLGGTGEGAVDV